MGKVVSEQSSEQTGFALLESIVVVVVLIVIAGAGYYVWHHRYVANSAADKATATQASTANNAAQAKTSFAYGLIYDTYLSQVPENLQKAIVSEMVKDPGKCVKNGEIVDTTGKPIDRHLQYMPDGFAQTSIGCTDTESALFVLDGAEWKEADSTTYMYQCTILKQYKVPLKFLEATDPRRPIKCVEYPFDNPSSQGKEVIYKG
ncbi:MAG TPA: hypothetical protein VFL85_00780 [Candidatus Saccharimonadales bacterium]|nr:hypothetical protein [Candidatus Saccharimonadales bacterium]